MQEIDDIIRWKRVEPKTFHPIRERSEDSWFPGNEAASLVIQVGHIWDDITELKKLYENSKNEYVKKLLLKYVVVEARSLIEVFDRLQGFVFKAPVFDPTERPGWREITQTESDTARRLLKDYSKAKAETASLIISIRNQVGAHRGNLDWQQVMKFWDSLTPEVVNPVLKAVPPAFDYIKKLDLFEWNRTHEDGSIEFISAQLRSEYFKTQ